MLIEDCSFFVIFLHWWGFNFVHARGIPASVTDQGTNSEEYTKVEHVISGLASSKLPAVIIQKKLFFLFTFSFFWCYSSYFFPLRRCCLIWLISRGKIKLLDVVNIMTEKMVTVLFRDTSVKKSPVYNWYSSGNYRRYFSGKTLLIPLFFRLNAIKSAIFPFKRR